MLELRILNGAQAMPLFDLPALLGRKQAAREVGDQIEALIAFMDDLGGDPDMEEDNEDVEHCGREPDDDAQGDGAWIEWHTRGSHKLRNDAELIGYDKTGWPLHEDAEDDDPTEDDDSDRCSAGDDHITSGAVAMREWWQNKRNPGDEVDAEKEHGDDGQAWPEVGAGKQPACMDVNYTDSEDEEPKWVGNFAADILSGVFTANDA